MLMLNNILMASQSRGYGNKRLAGGRGQQAQLSGLNQLDQTIMGRLMFNRMPGQAPMNQGQPAPSPAFMNKNPYQNQQPNQYPGPPGQPGYNPGQFNGTGPLNQNTGPLGNPPVQPDNPALQNMFGTGPLPNAPGQLGMYPPQNAPNFNGYNAPPPMPGSGGYPNQNGYNQQQNNGYGY